MTDAAVQFGRYFQIAVGSADGMSYLDLSKSNDAGAKLHSKFTIHRGDTQTPNFATVRIYNLSRVTQASLSGAPTSEFTSLSIIAGYESNYGLIFSGNIRYVATGHESATDSYVDIVAADGDAAYNFAFVNQSLAAGATPADQIAACVKTMTSVTPSATPGYITSPLNGTALPRGKVLFGMARDHMAQIAASTGSQWSIQDGQVQVVSQLDVLPNTAVVINSATGMIGFPSKTIQGVHVRTLLNPAIKINAKVQINNADIIDFSYPQDNSAFANPAFASQTQAGQAFRTAGDGIYQVLWVEHFGDTRGNEWYSDIICVDQSLQGTGFNINSTKYQVAPDAVVTLPIGGGNG